MTRKLTITRVSSITDPDDIITILDDELTLGFDSPQMVYKIVDPWFDQLIRLTRKHLRFTSYADSFDVFSKIIKPDDFLTVLNRRTDFFEANFKFPSVEFHFLSKTITPDANSTTCETKLEVKVPRPLKPLIFSGLIHFLNSTR